MEGSLKLILDTLFGNLPLNSWTVFDKGNQTVCTLRFNKIDSHLKIEPTKMKKVSQKELDRDMKRSMAHKSNIQARETRSKKNRQKTDSENDIEQKRSCDNVISSPDLLHDRLFTTPLSNITYSTREFDELSSLHMDASAISDDTVGCTPTSTLYEEPMITPPEKIMISEKLPEDTDQDECVSSGQRGCMFHQSDDVCSYTPFVPQVPVPSVPNPVPHEGRDDDYTGEWCYHPQCVYGFGYVKPNERREGFKFRSDVYVCDLHGKNDLVEICQNCMDHGAHDGHRNWMRRLTYD